MDEKKHDHAGEPVLNEFGHQILDENGEPVRWATKKQRFWALLGAIAVILLTLAYAYSIATGDLFVH